MWLIGKKVMWIGADEPPRAQAHHTLAPNNRRRPGFCQDVRTRSRRAGFAIYRIDEFAIRTGLDRAIGSVPPRPCQQPFYCPTALARATPQFVTVTFYTYIGRPSPPRTNANPVRRWPTTTHR